MQKNIHFIIICMLFSIVAFCNEEPKTKKINPLPLYVQNNEVFQARHDGKHFFIAPTITVAQPTQADIESAIADAQTQGRVIKITSSGFSIPAALKEVTSLPVTFRNQIDGWNYDITVFAMTFTQEGSKLSIGCKFNLPNNQAIYFGANDIATSGKNGFLGELPILTNTLTNAKQAELDDVEGLLGGETHFYEVSIPNFNDKLKMGLNKDTKLHFECGTFKKFTLSGYLKSFDAVERENNDGNIINDGKPLMLFFSTKDVFDWQDMYFEASVSRSFHHANLKELGFNFSSSNKAIIDLSKVQNPPNLPTCVNADGWQGVYFPTFQVRLPQFFKLRDGVTLASRTGKNLFIDQTGLLGNMTAEKVYELNEGYTDNVNQFDMSLDLLSANFVCNQAPMVSMLGRIQLGKCSSASNQANKLLYYNVIYDKVRNGYSFLVKEKESGNYSSNTLNLETGSTVNFGISGSSLVLNTKLSKTPIIKTTAYNNSVCSNFETNLSISDCTTGMFKWSTTSGDENVNPLTVRPITTLANEQIVYRANCFDKYCISENSNAITLTVYNGLPDLTLSSDKSVMCSKETATITVGNTCAGEISWITPENTSFTVNNLTKKEISYPDLSSTQNKEYIVRCELNGCLSNQNTEARAIVTIKKAPSKPILMTLNSDNSENSTHTVCSGNAIVISGSCPDADAIFTWTAGLSNTDANPYTLTTDINNPRSKEYVYKAICTHDGCATEADLTVKESPIPKPTHFFATRNPIEIGGVAEIAALGCPQGSDIWSNGKTANWNGQNGVTMIETLNENTTYSVRCVVNGCSSLPTTPITIYVQTCEQAYPAPKTIGIIDGSNDVLPNTAVKLYASGCTTQYEWIHRVVSGNNDGESSIITVNPSETTTYKVRCKKGDYCKSAWSEELTIRVKSCEEGISAPKAIGSIDGMNDVTPNTSVKLYASGCTNEFEWEHGVVSNKNDGESSIITVNPSETTTYKVRCKIDNACKSAWSAGITIRVKSCEEGISAPSYIGSDLNDVLPNTSIKLYARGCLNQYEWSHGIASSNIEDLSTSITVNPSETTSYKVRCKQTDICKSGWTATYELRVKTCETGITSPTTIGSVDNINDISSNTSLKLYAMGCGSMAYEWSNGTISANEGSNNTSITINPSETTIYKVRCKMDEGCKSTWSGDFEVRVNVKILNTDPNWVFQNNICENNQSFKIEKDSNPNSTTYNKSRKIEGGGLDCKCDGKSTEAIWVNQNKDVCIEGNPFMTEKDTNNCSPTYSTLRTINRGSKDCSICADKSKSPDWQNQNKTICKNDISYLTEKDMNECSPSYNSLRTTTKNEASEVMSKPIIKLNKSKVFVGEPIIASSSCPSSSTLVWTSPNDYNGGSYTPSLRNSFITFKAKCIKVGSCDSQEGNISIQADFCSDMTEPTITVTNYSGINITATCSNGIVVWTSPSGFNGGAYNGGTIFSAKCVKGDCESATKTITKPNTPIVTVDKSVPWQTILNVSCSSGLIIDDNGQRYGSSKTLTFKDSDFCNNSYQVSFDCMENNLHSDYSPVYQFYGYSNSPRTVYGEISSNSIDRCRIAYNWDGIYIESGELIGQTLYRDKKHPICNTILNKTGNYLLIKDGEKYLINLENGKIKTVENCN